VTDSDRAAIELEAGGGPAWPGPGFKFESFKLARHWHTVCAGRLRGRLPNYDGHDASEAPPISSSESTLTEAYDHDVDSHVAAHWHARIASEVPGPGQEQIGKAQAGGRGLH
jgi:hypothetical protein